MDGIPRGPAWYVARVERVIRSDRHCLLDCDCGQRVRLQRCPRRPPTGRLIGFEGFFDAARRFCATGWYDCQHVLERPADLRPGFAVALQQWRDRVTARDRQPAGKIIRFPVERTGLGNGQRPCNDASGPA